MTEWIARAAAWIRTHKLHVLGYSALAYSVWLLITEDGRLIGWRAGALAAILILLTVDSVWKHLARRRRRRSAGPSQSDD